MGALRRGAGLGHWCVLRLKPAFASQDSVLGLLRPAEHLSTRQHPNAVQFEKIIVIVAMPGISSPMTTLASVPFGV